MKKVKWLLSLLLAVVMLLSACATQGGTATKEEKLKPGIYLCAELHSMQRCIDNELKRWGEFYAKGARHLFLENTYAAVAYLNEWMHSDSDDILEELMKDLEGTLASSQEMRYFYHTIKENYPETIFHSTDLGHQYESTGARYVKKLEEEGKKDTEEYKRAVENNESGKRFYDSGDYDTVSGANYRESKLVEYFIREYEALSGEFVMGIYGWGHLELDSTHCYEGTDQQMVVQLKEKYGNLIQVEGMTWVDPISTEKLTINEKEYDSEYYGEFDISYWECDIEKFRMWKIENAYEDLKDNSPYDDWFMVYECPFEVKENEIYIIDYVYYDGTIERIVYKSDRVNYDGSPAIHAINID